jgi:hypothetical protein
MARLLLRFEPKQPTAVAVARMLNVWFLEARSIVDLTPGNLCFWGPTAPVTLSEYDFRALPYANRSFDLAVFDPPHRADQAPSSVMFARYGTVREKELEPLVRAGCREAWRVARMGIVVKVTDGMHASRFVRMSGWVYDELGEPFDVVHVQHHPLLDRRWKEPQLSARNNGSTYIAFRKDGRVHKRWKGGSQRSTARLAGRRPDSSRPPADAFRSRPALEGSSDVQI